MPREAPKKPSLVEALRAAFDKWSADLFVAMPCKVQKYDAEKQRADLIPVIERGMRGADGTLYTEDLPILPAVQVCHTGGGGYFVQHELKPGDTVLAVFCDQDPGNFIDSESSLPVDDRYHAIGGAVCFPVRFQGVPAFAHLAMGHDSGKQIHVKPDQVCLGSENPTDVVTLANKLIAKFNSHTHPYTDTGATPPASVTSPPSAPLSQSDVGSSVVKSD